MYGSPCREELADPRRGSRHALAVAVAADLDLPRGSSRAGLTIVGSSLPSSAGSSGAAAARCATTCVVPRPVAGLAGDAELSPVAVERPRCQS